jgi:hypothetical protein
MAAIFKEFGEDEVLPFNYNNRVDITLSTGSPSASDVHFFTGVRSLGKIKFFDTNAPPSFGLTLTRELKYQFLYDKSTIPGSSTTGERTRGIFLSDPDQSFKSSTHDSSQVGHQGIFNYTHGYLYRNDNEFVQGVTALRSTSTALDISVNRLITIKRDLFKSTIEPNSFRMEMNYSNTSATGIVNSTNATGMVTALDLKNPYGGEVGTGIKSFAGVKWEQGTSLDTATSGLTIEAVIRPFDKDSVLMWRRLSSEGWGDGVAETENSFLKLELTRSPDNTKNAFRFYIRSVTANGDFSNAISKQNVQASGLFIPEDAGINLFDGKFHHIMVSWGISGINEATTIESGAGAVFGYIDGYKLLNRENTNPRLGGADSANGPTPQSNMFEQRFPIKTDAIQYVDNSDSISGNNFYIGMSNYNREQFDTIGDKGDLGLSGDDRLQGGYDGQIQHFRMWNRRFADGTTGVTDEVGKLISETTTAGISFSNFKDSTLTGGANTSSNLMAWWNFNERNTLSADDISQHSNTAQLVGSSTINLYDVEDLTITANDGSLADASASSIYRNHLYIDIPESNIIRNDFSQGRIVRRAADGSLIRVGVIYYELGIVVLDADDPNAKLNFLWPSSGTTGDFGFSVTANGNAALNVDRISFNSLDDRGRLMMHAVAEGNEYNYTENPSGINPETGESVFDEPTSYLTTVGLYNDFGELIAVGKLSVPAKKDESIKLETQIKLDF